MKKNDIIFYAVCVGLIILGFAIEGGEGEGLGVVLAFCGAFALYMKIWIGKQYKKQQAGKNMEFIPEHKLIVREKSPLNKKLIYISRYQETNLKYNPATATYTGVTVGGVTTGGWDVSEAHYSMEGGTITDKFIMWYRKDEKQSAIIKEIELTQEIADIAKRDSRLTPYLKGNTFYLSKSSENQWGDIVAQTLKNTGDFTKASSIAMKDYASTLLTKCKFRPNGVAIPK